MSNKKEIVIKPDWSRAKKYLDAAKKSAQVTLAYQVLVGKEISELKGIYNAQHGGDRKGSRFHDEILIGWDEAVKKELGISVATAWRWNAMWVAAKPRLKKLGIPDAELFYQLLDLPQSKMSQKQFELLEKSVHKLTDGKTQMELMLDWGLAKKPQGSGATGGYHPRAEGAPLVDPNAPAEIARLMIMVPYQQMIQEWQRHWANLERAHLEELLGTFEGLTIDLRRALKK